MLMVKLFLNDDKKSERIVSNKIVIISILKIAFFSNLYYSKCN